MIAVVIPCFKVKKHILQVIYNIGPEVQKIFVVDDACPEKSGRYVQQQVVDERVEVIFHDKNQGVGGAVISGYKRAMEDPQISVIVKLDGDGQMNPDLILDLVQPIIDGRADYSKGNRFYDLTYLRKMPKVRLLGNSFLSFLNKMVSGYWNIMDPTNGFTAIHSDLLPLLPLNNISNRYFFESDMLFRLSTVRAVVADLPMHSVYNDEESNLSISKVAVEFPPKYCIRFLKRIFYNYFLRDFNAGTFELLMGAILLCFGVFFGSMEWYESIKTGLTATSGTVMLAALPLIIGFQLLLAFISFDINNVPKVVLHRKKVKTGVHTIFQA